MVMGVALFGVLLVMLILGVPIALSMGLASLTALNLGQTATSNLVLVQRMFTALDSFPFMAIPFFILAGDLMQTGGISTRLINFLKLVLNRVPARLAVIDIVGSGFFGAISGSNPATVAAIGGILVPEMKKAGYPADKAGAIAASGGTLGVIIPPSISMVTYSLVASVSIGDMFLGGIVPGALLCLALTTVCICTCYRIEKRITERVPWLSLLKAFWDALAALMMPVIILGGIYGQFCTPTEAAAVACVYAYLISAVAYRELKLRDMAKVLSKAAINTSIVLLTVAMAAPFSWLMTSQNIPPKIMQALLDLVSNKYAIFLIMNTTLLFLGCFLETQSIILLMTPILLPIAKQFGLDPIALGLIVVINTSIGMITPPMAVNLFVASSISGASVESISRRILPFLAAAAGMLILFTYVPEILTFLPNLLK